MSDRMRDGTTDRGPFRRAPRRASRPQLEAMEGRPLMASLAPIADVTAPTLLGLQLPLNGGATGDQTYTVKSDNPSIKASIAQGKFLTIGVSHTSSGPNDPSFTGSITFQLFDDLTPNTTAKIEQLVNQGFYTSPTTASPILPSKNFHRIANQFPNTTDYIVQGGSQTGNGSGSLNQPGFPFADEFNQQLAFTGSGQLAMANAGDDTNDSQFFITTGSPRFLDFNHTIFGQIVAGQSTLGLMTQVAKNSDGQTPTNPILFTSTTLSNTNPNGVIHFDLTNASIGQTSHVTVTAKDASGATVTRAFNVNVGANLDQNGQPLNERAFLLPVANQVVGAGQTAVFQLNANNPEPTDTLTYNVGSGATTGTNPTFTPIPASQGTATVDANGVVTVTPAANFTGVINLLVGVRDQVNRSGTGTGQTIDNIGNYDTQKISVTVTNGAVVNLAPIAVSGSTTVPTGASTTVQLTGNTANPGSTTQTLQYSLLTQPTNGTISNFNATTGSFTYTPNANFLGTDSLTFNVRDVGAPTPNLTSQTAVETITVGGASTGAVRLINRTLIVTPPPKATLADTSTNTIQVNQTAAGLIQVRVNGLIDNTMPASTDLDRIVVYGSKNGDTITVGPEVTLPTTLDGGHGGVNFLTAGAGDSTMSGFFKQFSVLQGGPGNDILTGQKGRVKFLPSGGSDRIAAVEPRLGRRDRSAIFPGKQFNAKPNPPRATFYKFVGKRLVPIKSV